MTIGNGTTESGTGAMPGPGAMPGQPAPIVPPAGAMPVPAAAGAPPAPAAPAVTPPAMGDDQLGAAGQRALEIERQARRDAEARAQSLEQERDQLKAATQSDAEKALTQARREAAAEERTKWTSHIRNAEVRSVLRAAGLTNEKTLALAAQAPEFARLKVTDEGTVEKLADAIAQFRSDYPELFASGATTPPTPAPAPPATPPTPGGAWGGSEGGTRTPPEAGSLEAAVMDRMSKTR